MRKINKDLFRDSVNSYKVYLYEFRNQCLNPNKEDVCDSFINLLDSLEDCISLLLNKCGVFATNSSLLKCSSFCRNNNLITNSIYKFLERNSDSIINMKLGGGIDYNSITYVYSTYFNDFKDQLDLFNLILESDLDLVTFTNVNLF